MRYNLKTYVHVYPKKFVDLPLFKNTTLLTKTNLVILIAISAIAILLSVFSYQYYTFTSAKISDIASHEIKTNAQIQVHDLSQTLSNRFESINALLQTLADSPAIHNNEYERASIVINTRQQYSNQLTDFYMWLDKNGKINWSSNINQSVYQKYKGTDLSFRPYFSIPRDTHSAYYSSLIESNDKVPRLYVSYPVINMTGKGSPGIFTGVVVASIRSITLGNVLQHQLIPQFNSTVGLLDRKGIVLYSSTPSFIGKDVFGKDIQSMLSSLLPLEAKDSLNNIIRNSLQGSTGSGDISIQGKTSTISYEPVKINGKYFLTLYIVGPHNLASDVGLLINQQKYVSTIVVIVIAAVAFGIAFLVLLWNKKLKTTVDKRTAELKTANEQLKIHDKMQKEFINVASHEIKTPTQALLGYSEILQTHPEKREEMSQAIFRNANRLQRLTNDILDVTRIESQTLKLNKEQFNLADLISSVVEDFKNDIQKKGSDIKLFYEPQDHLNLILEADKGRLTQVISNLLSNAIKFTNQGGGTIFIATSTIQQQIHNKDIDKKVLVSIKDDGRGIDPSMMSRLFTKFASKSETGGTGLGLFISKSIIEAHGGRIWAKNNADGKGATFTFTLPISKEQHAAVA
ncbi:MAG: sensor histidine kinase [Nitrososphaeraceae archaeon]|nr:sensor histidine kinase [Nitrososphaeraceae archaeon]